jgi:hypothetical protein
MVCQKLNLMRRVIGLGGSQASACERDGPHLALAVSLVKDRAEAHLRRIGL